MPIAALLPAIIGAAGSIGGSLINRSATKGITGSGAGGTGPLLPAGLDQEALKDLITKQTGMAGTLQDYGAKSLGTGTDTLRGPLAYYDAILGGDRGAMMEAAAPEIAAINAQFRAPLENATLGGRGGALASDLEAQRQSAISNFLFQQRPQAADKLSGIAQNLMNLGTQQFGVAGQELGNASRDVLDYNQIIRGIQAQTRMDTPNMLGQLGGSLGPLLGGILGGIFGKGGGGTNPTLPQANPPVWSEVPTLPLPNPGGGWLP